MGGGGLSRESSVSGAFFESLAAFSDSVNRKTMRDEMKRSIRREEIPAAVARAGHSA